MLLLDVTVAAVAEEDEIAGAILVLLKDMIELFKLEVVEVDPLRSNMEQLLSLIILVILLIIL